MDNTVEFSIDGIEGQGEIIMTLQSLKSLIISALCLRHRHMQVTMCWTCHGKFFHNTIFPKWSSSRNVIIGIYYVSLSPRL